MLQNDIDEIKDYFRSLETYNDALIVRVQFPPKWKVFPSDDGTKKVAVSDNNPHEYFYYGDGNNVSLDDLFGLIKDTIGFNQSLEEKEKLLMEKIHELQDIFTTCSLDKLRTLKFVLEEPKKTKAKRKYTNRKKPSSEIQDEPKTEVVQVDKNTETNEANDNGEIKISTETLNKLSKIKQKKVSD